MENSIQFSPELFTSERKKKTAWKRVLGVLACIVVFCTTYALILPAITATLTCGKEEHVHTDDTAHPELYLLMMAGAGAILLILGATGRKRRDENDE